ncbi:TraB/GumN family protein [Kiloniella majae]|uniref:TraB/GumN family protein n=1 Tax=Kiloniella majae TaxID=1938558 RepID=UPI000A277951|nr:TraB/GumN family protein [Kiloniella majae]
MIFRCYKILVLFIFTSYFLLSGEAWSEATIPYGKGLFWKIEKNNRAPSYLLGTMHVADPRVLKIKDRVEPYIKNADVLNLEIDLTPREVRESYNVRIRDDGKTLDEILPEDLYEKIVRIAEKQDVKEEVLQNFELWAVYPILKALPNDPDREKQENNGAALDFQLGAFAVGQGVEVNGLETVREQLSVFRDRDREIYLDAIIRALEKPEAEKKHEDLMEQYVQMYLTEDTNSFYQTLLDDLKEEPPEMYDIWITRLLDKRNLNMINGMTKGLIKGNSFTAVGALHLPGEKGILNMLVQRGYQVSRVPCKNGEKSSFCPNQDM